MEDSTKNAQKELLVNKIKERADQLAGLAISLMLIGNDCRMPDKGLIYETELDNIGAIKSLGRLDDRLQNEIDALSEELILSL